jgi:hypothetical protein
MMFESYRQNTFEYFNEVIPLTFYTLVTLTLGTGAAQRMRSNKKTM